jgi:hypothetical protein
VSGFFIAGGGGWLKKTRYLYKELTREDPKTTGHRNGTDTEKSFELLL